MRILVVSNSEWSDNNAFGNTMSNWFEGMPGTEFFSIYRRISIPNNTVCTNYYSIPSQDILKFWFTSSKIGRAFSSSDAKSQITFSDKGKFEKGIISIIRQMNIQFAYQIDSLLFKSKKWDNGRLLSFITECNPDIIFFFITGSEQGTLLLECINRISPRSKFVSYIADDVYGREKSLKKREGIAKQIAYSSKIYGASEILCKEYNNLFNVDIEPLYKGCELSSAVYNTPNEIIKIVYAGNLYYGRGETLAKLAEAISHHNLSSARHLELQIYTTTTIPKKLQKRLNIEGASKIYGSRSYNEIKEIMANSDLVLHVESFNEKQKRIVRYSFSTKIIDCLQSGAVLLAIGPTGIASIEYIRNIPGAYTVDKLEDLDSEISNIIKSDLVDRARQIRNFAHENHNRKSVQAKLKSDFDALVK